MVSVGGEIGSVLGGFNTGALMSAVMSIVQLLFYAGIGILFLRWYINREKYNMTGEIWTMQDGAVTPMIDHVRGGWFDSHGLRDFQLLGKKYNSAVVNINPKHIIRDGKKLRFWLRRAGSREFYSFFPKVWMNKKGKKDFVLEVEDSSIVNQAIIKDKQIRARHTQEDKLKEMMPFIAMGMMFFAIIIVAYFTYDYLEGVVAMANSCTAQASAIAEGWA